VTSTLTGCRFEKSLYDLIRGLRNHKGNEKEYIQKSLKECRAEIRGSDMGMSASTPHVCLEVRVFRGRFAQGVKILQVLLDIYSSDN
jgi:hypothetical protein